MQAAPDQGSQALLSQEGRITANPLARFSVMKRFRVGVVNDEVSNAA